MKLDINWIKHSEALVALVAFVFSLLAAIWALELYQLLRTGAIGKSWRVFIVAALVFMVHEVTHMVRIFGAFDDLGMYEATKLIFVALMAYGFYAQRRVFFSPQLFRAVLNHRRPTAVDAEEPDESTVPLSN